MGYRGEEVRGAFDGKLRAWFWPGCGLLCPFAWRLAVCTLILLAPASGAAAEPQLLINPSFELSPTQNGWSVDDSVRAKGRAFRSTSAVRAGKFSLELEPNAANSAEPRLATFGVVQFIPAANLRGKPVYFGGHLWARGGATAVLRVWTVGQQAIELREVRRDSGLPTPERLRDVFDVPADPGVTVLAIGCAVEGQTGAAYFDDLVVTTEQPEYIRTISTAQPGAPLPAQITVLPGSVGRAIPRTLYGTNIEWGWNAQGIWNEGLHRPNPGVTDLMKSMGVSTIRFPGGILSDLYHWKDGLGPVTSRPGPVRMPGGSSSRHSFGTDEALELAQSVGANLMITVNLLSGTPEEAADWVKYVKERGADVPLWEVGNELYLDFTSFDPPADNWDADRYADTFLRYAAAMKAVDPEIKLGAGLEYAFTRSAFRVHPGWEETVLRKAAPSIDFVSVHNGFAPVLPIEDAGWDGRTVYSSLLAAPILIKDSLDRLSNLIESTAGPHARHIDIAVTEWGPGFKIEPDSRWVDHLKTLGSALYVGSVLKAFIETPRVIASHAFKLSDGSAQGWIGVREQQFVAKPVAMAMQMYAQHFGTRFVNSSVAVEGYESRSLGHIEALPNVPYLDVVCSLNESGDVLYVMAINKHFDREIDGAISLAGHEANGTATAWTLNGKSLDAHPGTELPAIAGFNWARQEGVGPNSRIDVGGPGEVEITEQSLGSLVGPHFTYRFPAHSITSIVIPIRSDGSSVEDLKSVAPRLSSTGLR